MTAKKRHKHQPEKPGIHLTMPVRDMLAPDAQALRLKLITGPAGLDRLIRAPRIQKPGLALAGYTEYIHPGRVQILGVSEITFLRGQRPDQRRRAISSLLRADMCCIIITTSQKPPEELMKGVNERSIPVFSTPLASSQCIEKVQVYLSHKLAPMMSIHGDLLDIFGLGVLITGPSGIGKSECALDLIVRGHRLIADDIVEIRRDQTGQLFGVSPDLIKHHMELRGIGLINIHDMFGVSAISPLKSVDIVVDLEEWVEGREYDRLGLDDRVRRVFDVDVPLIRMPVGPGRNLAILIEVAARNQLLKNQGYHPAKRFNKKLNRRLSQKS